MMPPLAPADEVAAVLRRETPGALAALRRLPPEAWREPSQCAGWTQAQVITHLTEGTFGFLVVRLSASMDGETLNDPRDGPLRDPRYRAVDARLSEGPNQDVVGAFAAAADLADPVLGRVEARHGPLPTWHRRPEYVATVQEILHARLMELVLHTWDVLSRHGPAPLPPATLPYLLRWEYEKAWRFLPAERADGGRAGVVRFAPAVSQPFSVRVGPTGATEDEGDESPNLLVRAEDEALVLLLGGRLPIEQAEAGGVVHLEGDPGVARTLRMMVGPF